MRRLHFVLLVLLLALAHDARANPIMWSPSFEPATMVQESVQVEVGAGESKVTGTYRFRINLWSPLPHPGSRLRVTVPVLLPPEPKGATGRQADPPTVSASSREYATTRQKEPPFGYGLRGVPLPPGWTLAMYECHIPVREEDGELEIRLAYTQPHFPGDIAGYLPVDPPTARHAATVTFTAAPGRVLQPVTRWARLFPHSRSTLTVKPANLRLIQVKSLPAGPRP